MDTKLNALVTEKIMGMEPSQCGGYHRKNRKDTFQIVPDYRNDLALAWTAADHMCERYRCAIKVERVLPVWERHAHKRYVASVNGGTIAYARFDCILSADSNESPAHALCLVMLEAVKSVVSEDEA